MAADPPDTIYLDEDDEWSCVHDPASSGADGEEFDVCCEDDGLRPPTASESTGVKLPTVRSLDNLSLLEAQMGGCQHALLLDANESILEERLMQPAANGGKPAEATAEGAQRRIRTFKNQTLPAILALEGRGKLTRVDASGSPDATFAAVSAAYQSMGLQ